MEKSGNWSIVFRKNKLKVTKARLLIAKELEASSQPISAEDLFVILKTQEEKIDLSTIYRTLEVLVKKRIVKKICFLGDEKAMFAVEKDDHCHYLICKSCHKIITITKCPIAMYEKKLQDETGFEIEDHTLYLYGRCKECLKKEK